MGLGDDAHPHIHMIVPGGGLSVDGTRWTACRPGFFLPIRALGLLLKDEPTRLASHPEADHRLLAAILIGSSAV
jgi:Putative transposase